MIFRGIEIGVKCIPTIQKIENPASRFDKLIILIDFERDIIVACYKQNHATPSGEFFDSLLSLDTSKTPAPIFEFETSVAHRGINCRVFKIKL